MPYRKTYRRKRRRKPSKNTLVRSRATYMKGPQKSLPLGKSFKFQTRYVDTRLQLDPVTDTPRTHVFSLTGLYDPDVTGTGHQPIGFDQLMAMYDHYTVIGAKYRVTFSNQDTTKQALVACQIKDTATTSTNIDEIIENGQTKYTTLGVEASGNSVRTLAGGINTSKFFGRKVMDGTKYNGTDGANPNDQIYLHITVGPKDYLEDNFPVTMTVQIDYIAILTEPKQLVQS